MITRVRDGWRPLHKITHETNPDVKDQIVQPGCAGRSWKPSADPVAGLAVNGRMTGGLASCGGIPASCNAAAA